MEETPITLAGKLKIEAELDHLVKIEREQVKKDIAEARELGDLKENAEYHAAKERQGVIEGRISQLQGIIARARVVEINKITNTSRIVFGATVTLFDPEKDVQHTYKLVGEEEAEFKENKISYISPLGKALIGKEVGDTIIVKAPKGDVEYEIEDIKYID
jgi:transcription elongation factor GreA